MNEDTSIHDNVPNILGHHRSDGPADNVDTGWWCLQTTAIKHSLMADALCNSRKWFVVNCYPTAPLSNQDCYLETVTVASPTNMRNINKA